MSISESLVARADELRARFKALESLKGSGYHSEDRNIVNPNLFTAPQKNGYPKASEHVVFFVDYDEEQVHFAGEDADKVLSNLQSWMALSKDIDLSVGTVRKMIRRIIPRLKIQDGLLTIWLSDWNDVLYVLEELKVGVQGRSFVDDGSPLPGS